MKYTAILLSFLLCWSSQAASECGFDLERASLKKYRYIIVPGILNEVIAHYMTEQRRFLIHNGVPTTQIHRINLSSFAIPEDAVSVFEKYFERLPKDKDLIFIAHSKGALETLYFLKKHKEFKLKHALLIQGPLDGASITRLPDEAGFLGFLNFIVKKIISVSFVQAYDKSYSSDHVRSLLKDLGDYPELLKKIVFIESSVEYSKLKWKFKPLGSQYREFFGRAGDGVLMDTDHIPFTLKENQNICRLKYKVDHSDLVKAAPWNSLRVNRIKKFMERVFFRSTEV